MSSPEHELQALVAETPFSGVVRVDRGDDAAVAKAWGLADRRWEIPNDVDTRFALASGAKGLTALAVMSLVDDGTLKLSTPAREWLGADLPLIADDVTVEHLLAHRSGIGDYLDEEVEGDLAADLMPCPVQELVTTESYLAVLDGHPTKFAADERFSYSNSGFVVLALIAERASGVAYHDLVRQRVCEPAGLRDTEFLRSDELPQGAAVGYLDAEGLRTNVLHLPVRGNGDGGVYSTVADIRALWKAFVAGEIVPRPLVDEMVRPRSVEGTRRYGLGFWLHATSDAVVLTGSDAGVSFWSAHDASTDSTWTVVSNTTKGAWPIARHLSATVG